MQRGRGFYLFSGKRSLCLSLLGHAAEAQSPSAGGHRHRQVRAATGYHPDHELKELLARILNLCKSRFRYEQRVHCEADVPERLIRPQLDVSSCVTL